MKNDDVNFEGETEEENQEVQYQIIRVLGFLLILLKKFKTCALNFIQPVNV